MIKRLLLFVFLTVFLASAANATTYYVGTTGSNSNAGTSRTAPFLTCDYAATKVSAGDTVIIMAGTHTQFSAPYFMDIRASGTAAAPITFQGEIGTVIDGGYTAKYGIILWESAAYIVIKDLEITKCTENGIVGYGSYSLGGSDHVTIQNCHIHDIGNHEVKTCADSRVTYGMSGIMTNQHTSYYTLDGNDVHDIGRLEGGCAEHDYKHDHGWYAMGREHVSQNNTYWNCHAGWGIKIDGYCGTLEGTYSITTKNDTFAFASNPSNYGHITLYTNATSSCGDGTTFKYGKSLIENDIFYQPPSPGSTDAAIRIYNAYNSPCTMRNNITTSPNLYAIYSTPSTGGTYTASNNTVGYNASYFTNPSTTTPDFTPVASFYGIDHGYSNGLAYDKNGIVRPQGSGIDVGAIEALAEAGVTPSYSPAKLRISSGGRTWTFGPGVTMEITP